MPHRATDDPAQDVPPPFVGGQHAVGDEERDRARVVGDHLVAEPLRLEIARVVTEERAEAVVDRREEVRVEVRRDLLEHARQPLEAHPRVDALERQRVAPVGPLVELHEHEVPDLEPARTVLRVVRDALRPLGEVRAAVEVDLAARPARAGVGHPPEVVVVARVDIAPARHPVRRQADLVAPDRPGDVVVGVRGGGKPLFGDAQVLGQEVPREMDRLALEVVAEAPVAEHLEERVVARGPADLLEVVVLAGDSQDPLVVHRPGIRARLRPGQDLLELDHPGVREEQRLVAGRDEAGARDVGVAALLEELDETAADLGGGPGRDPGVVLGGRGRHRAQWYRTGDRPRPRWGSRGDLVGRRDVLRLDDGGVGHGPGPTGGRPARWRRRDHMDDPASTAPTRAPMVSPRRNVAAGRELRRPRSRPRFSDGPSTETTLTTSDADPGHDRSPRPGGSRRSEPIVSPRRSPSVSPAHAPRMAAATMSGSRPPPVPRITSQRAAFATPTRIRQHQRRPDTHADAARAGSRAIRPPPSTWSPS